MITSWVNNNWITVTLILLFGILVLLNYYHKKQFNNFIEPFNVKQYFVAYNSISNVFQGFNLLLLIFQIICFGLLFMKVNEYLVHTNNIMSFSVQENDIGFFFKIIGYLLMFYVGRYLIGKLVAFPFKKIGKQEIVSFMKVNHFGKVSLLIFPFLALFSYINFKNGLLFFALGILALLISLIKYANLLVYCQKSFFKRLYHFILYLCILEILPFYLFYKLLIANF